MAWDIEFTDEFEAWWETLDAHTQAAIDAKVTQLEEQGPYLQRPAVETLAKQSEHPNMKELRVQHGGDAYRILFAWDPRRTAILLMGGRKPDNRWYKKAVPQADKLYERHLEELKREGLIP